MERDKEENIIKETFDNIDLPTFNVMENIEAQTIKKSSRPLKRVFIVVFVTLSLLMTTAASAQYFGSFERLRNIIGENAAAVMRPVVNENNQGPQFIGEILTEDGIRAELVAAGLFDNVVDIFITLEDTVGDRFASNFALSNIGIVEFHLELEDMEPRNTVTISPQVIHNDNGILTLHGRKIFPFSVVDKALNFSIGRINYHPSGRIFHDIDLSEIYIPAEPPTLLLSNAEEQRAVGRPAKILKPHQTNHEFGIEGVFEKISSIGWVEGKLHVQLYNPNRSNPWVSFVEGFDMALHLHTVEGFDFDDEGNPYTGGQWTPFPLYKEFVFDIAPADIYDYNFQGRFTAFNVVNLGNLGWNTALKVEAHERQLVADGLELSVGDSLINEIVVNPSGVRLSGIYTVPRDRSPLDDNPMFVGISGALGHEEAAQARWFDVSEYYTGDRTSLVINTSDGPVRGFLSFFSKDEDDGFIHIFGLNRFIDLDSVISVGIAGQHLIYFD